MKNNAPQPRNFTLIDVITLLTIAGVAVFFITRSFNQAEHINNLENTNQQLGEQLHETKTQLEYYQRGVQDSN